MKMEVAVSLLAIMRSHRTPEEAITVKEIASKWTHPDLESATEESKIRKIQRYMSEISSEIGGLSALAEVLDDAALENEISRRHRGNQALRYYIPPKNILHWFMSEEIATSLCITGGLIGSLFSGIEQLNTEQTIELANDILGGTKSLGHQKIAKYFRVAQDGLGRQRAKIDPPVLQTAINAVIQDKEISFTYQKQNGETNDRTVSPLGLIAKDGTIYMVAIIGLGPRPIHFALHRMSDPKIESRRPIHRPETFDLDNYIHETHELSHALGSTHDPIELILRVHKDAMFHFRERPLSPTQTFDKEPEGDWYKLSAKIPNTMLLVPFLLSMGGFIEVVGPFEIRTEIASRIVSMSEHYGGKRSTVID